MYLDVGNQFSPFEHQSAIIKASGRAADAVKEEI
jgi:hypothetical protein